MMPPPSANLLEHRSAQLWPSTTELVGLECELVATRAAILPDTYAKGLHAWFLQQVQQYDPQLSARLHDGTEAKAFADKGFTLSRLQGKLLHQGRSVCLHQGERYRWYITALDPLVCQFLHAWLQAAPTEVGLRGASLALSRCHAHLTPCTYGDLFTSEPLSRFSLSFVSPTSFRQRGHHLPLPLPFNVFQSYARRWLGHTETDADLEGFLAWVDQAVTLRRYELRTEKVPAAKQGMVTGFVGAVQFAVAPDASNWPLWLAALARFAPYCGTGHKTTFGLGQTRLGWHNVTAPALTASAESTHEAADRETTLHQYFRSLKSRQGGQRAEKTAALWAALVARREQGESLQAIAADLELPYETAKTYVKLARRALRERSDT